MHHMNREDHLREAQALVQQAQDEWGLSEQGDPYPRAKHLALLAQVHATLATVDLVAFSVAHLPPFSVDEEEEE